MYFFFTIVALVVSTNAVYYLEAFIVAVINCVSREWLNSAHLLFSSWQLDFLEWPLAWKAWKSQGISTQSWVDKFLPSVI